MSKLERVELFNLKSLSFFILWLLAILSISLGYEFYKYKKLTTFYDPLIKAEVIDQEIRMIYKKPQTAIKFRLDDGSIARSYMKTDIADLRGKSVLVELWVKNLTFYDYMRGFRSKAVIYEIYDELSIKERWYRSIASLHDDPWMRELYGALFIATPKSADFSSLIGSMGIGHLLAISGYHYGVISLIIFFLFRPIYYYFHNRYFPYRHGARDLFFIVLTILFFYLYTLEFVSSMVRAFSMVVVGFILYDRGVKIISLQTLFIAVALVLAFYPRLFFAIGFWFSSMGVLSIFVFLKYYSHLKPYQIFLLLHIWCYMVMNPIAFGVFDNFSLYHPLSIVFSLLFNIFYPLVAFLHLVGYGDIFDSYLLALFESVEVKYIKYPLYLGIVSVVLALAAMRYKLAFYALGALGLFSTIAAVYQIT